MENGIANCDHSRTCILNLVNFGLRTAKNWTGVSTHPTGGAITLGFGTHSSILSTVVLIPIYFYFFCHYDNFEK